MAEQGTAPRVEHLSFEGCHFDSAAKVGVHIQPGTVTVHDFDGREVWNGTREEYIVLMSQWSAS